MDVLLPKWNSALIPPSSHTSPIVEQVEQMGEGTKAEVVTQLKKSEKFPNVFTSNEKSGIKVSLPSWY